jgi:predicted DNA-binding transcriptional regulator AlpA
MDQDRVEVLTLERLTVSWQVAPRTVRRLVEDGVLPQVRLGGRVGYFWTDVWACEGGQPPTGEAEAYRAPLLTPEQVASRCPFEPSTLKSYAKGGQIPHRRIGSQTRFVSSEIDSWLGAFREELPLKATLAVLTVVQTDKNATGNDIYGNKFASCPFYIMNSAPSIRLFLQVIPNEFRSSKMTETPLNLQVVHDLIPQVYNAASAIVMQSAVRRAEPILGRRLVQIPGEEAAWNDLTRNLVWVGHFRGRTPLASERACRDRVGKIRSAVRAAKASISGPGAAPAVATQDAWASLAA